jgi:hypothetical protein
MKISLFMHPRLVEILAAHYLVLNHLGVRPRTMADLLTGIVRCGDVRQQERKASSQIILIEDLSSGIQAAMFVGLVAARYKVSADDLHLNPGTEKFCPTGMTGNLHVDESLLQDLAMHYYLLSHKNMQPQNSSDLLELIIYSGGRPEYDGKRAQPKRERLGGVLSYVIRESAKVRKDAHKYAHCYGLERLFTNSEAVL